MYLTWNLPFYIHLILEVGDFFSKFVLMDYVGNRKTDKGLGTTDGIGGKGQGIETCVHLIPLIWIEGREGYGGMKSLVFNSAQLFPYLLSFICFYLLSSTSAPLFLLLFTCSSLFSLSKGDRGSLLLIGLENMNKLELLKKSPIPILGMVWVLVSNNFNDFCHFIPPFKICIPPFVDSLFDFAINFIYYSNLFW